jgi:hypothetical protein
MVQYVTPILGYQSDHKFEIQLDDDDFAKLQTLDDPNIYLPYDPDKWLDADGYRVWKFKVKINNKYKSFEINILGLNNLYHFRQLDGEACNFQRNNLIMTNSKYRHHIKMWNSNKKNWDSHNEKNW